MNNVEVRLACRHQVRVNWNRKDDDIAFCRWHGWQHIRVVFPNEWHMFCADCTMSRWFGQSSSRAKAAMIRHVENHPHHRVFALVDTVTRDGKGIKRAETLSALAREAMLWDDEITSPNSDDTEIIPF